MRLLPLTQLQTVLQMSEEFIGAGQLMKFFSADVTFIMQLL